MMRTILCGIALAVLCCGQAVAGDNVHRGRLELKKARVPSRLDRDARIQPRRGPAVIGKKGRKQIRRSLLRDNLRGDKQRVYDTYGYTPHRLGYNSAGRRSERWKYYTEGLEFVFDQQDSPVNYAIFGPEFTFTGQMVEGEVTITDPLKP